MENKTDKRNLRRELMEFELEQRRKYENGVIDPIKIDKDFIESARDIFEKHGVDIDECVKELESRNNKDAHAPEESDANRAADQ